METEEERMNRNDQTVAEAMRIALERMQGDQVRMPTRRDYAVARHILGCWYKGKKIWSVAIGVRERLERAGFDPERWTVVDGEKFRAARLRAEGELYEHHLVKVEGAQKRAELKRGPDMLVKWRKEREKEEFE
jgi:hypothetical protein